VYAVDYGSRATGPIEASADEIAAFARDVMRRTGASSVSFVGHSQGGPGLFRRG
jgi:triacylglycerol lipase